MIYPPTVYAISGKMGCGKSTLAGHLADLLRERGVVARMGFAQCLKEEVAAITGIEVDWLNSQEGKKLKMKNFGPQSEAVAMSMRFDPEKTVREFLQWYGTEWMRGRCPEHWVEALKTKLVAWSAAANDGDSVIVDDLRFKNEARMLKEWVTFLIRVEAYDGYHTEREGTHPSETELDDWSKWHIWLQPKYGELAQAAKTILEETDKM
jgi:energy-coupling factor transporter ATP-binding protein EcfA2